MGEIDDAGWREATPSEKSQTINISTNVYDNINILQNASKFWWTNGGTARCRGSVERDRAGAAARRAAQGLWRWGSRGDGGVGILLTAEADVQKQVYDTNK